MSYCLVFGSIMDFGITGGNISQNHSSLCTVICHFHQNFDARNKLLNNSGGHLTVLFIDFSMGMVSTIKLIYTENGITRGLYRGMSINYLRAIPMVAVSFSTYELVKQTLKLDTGLSIKTG